MIRKTLWMFLTLVLSTAAWAGTDTVVIQLENQPQRTEENVQVTAIGYKDGAKTLTAVRENGEFFDEKLQFVREVTFSNDGKGRQFTVRINAFGGTAQTFTNVTLKKLEEGQIKMAADLPRLGKSFSTELTFEIEDPTAPKPAAEETPEAVAEKPAEPTPTATPAPSPTPAPTPEPTATPAPSPSPAPAKKAEPTPEPTPEVKAEVKKTTTAAPVETESSRPPILLIVIGIALLLGVIFFVFKASQPKDRIK